MHAEHLVHVIFTYVLEYMELGFLLRMDLAGILESNLGSLHRSLMRNIIC